MKAGSCAAEGYEPRQVREEAAVSRCLRVPQGSLAGADWHGKPGGLGRQQVHDPFYHMGMARLPARDDQGDLGEELSVAQTRRWLRRLGHRAREGWGQHFLIDRRVLRDIVSASELTPTDIVVEVGPGLGILTLELARRAGRVLAVEIDPRLAGHLRRLLIRHPNVAVINADILSLSPLSLLKDYVEDKAPQPSYKVVANLPYYITSAVLRHFLSAPAKPSLMVVMVQREVAEAIICGPGHLSQLAISVQVYGSPQVVARVPPRSFYPPPKVSSAVLRIEPWPQPKVAPEAEAAFFSLVEAGFSAPRKQLHNSLALGLGMAPDRVAEMLNEIGINPTRRAQTLSLEEWSKLSSKLGKSLGKEGSHVPTTGA